MLQCLHLQTLSSHDPEKKMCNGNKLNVEIILMSSALCMCAQVSICHIQTNIKKTLDVRKDESRLL